MASLEEVEERQLRCYKVLALTTLLHCSETGDSTKKEENMLRTAQMKLSRNI